MTGPYKARGVVLHTVKYGESSLVAYLFTDVGGRSSYMVRGVRSRRGHGNKAALFQPMFLIDFEAMASPHAQMHSLREVRSLVPLASIPFDVRKSTVSLFMAEVLYRLVREEEANQPLFDFLCEAVRRLDALESGIANFHLWFLVRLSAYLGFYPGNEYRSGAWFDIRSGLFCAQMPQHRTCMQPDSAALLGALMECPQQGFDRLSLSRDRRQEFMEAMLAFFGYHFDSIHAVRSLHILREVFS